MQNTECIKSSLEYIDNTLPAIPTTEELANMAGYSLWHYCRMFTQVVGQTVTAYICKRRIDMALNEISNGCKAVEVMEKYGFETYAGFYKAFIRLYGCSPKKYLSIYGKYTPRLEGKFLMLQEQELRAAISHWDIPQDIPLNDIHKQDGAVVSGNVWTLSNEYILKAEPRDRMLINLRFIKALAAQGSVSSLPLPTKTGEEYLDGDPIFMLSRKNLGSPLPNCYKFGDKRRDYGMKYGQSIAKLHLAFTAIESDIMPYEENLYKQVMEWALPNIQKQNEQWRMGLPDRFFEDYAINLGSLFDKLPKQLIHRDPNPSNIMFDGGEVSGFINYELCERNIRLWDSCYCATGILSEWNGVENICEKWPLILDGILHGYDSVNPLTTEEKQAVYYVLCSIQMICTAYFDSVEELRELAKSNREMLKFISENKTSISNIFE